MNGQVHVNGFIGITPSHLYYHARSFTSYVGFWLTLETTPSHDHQNPSEMQGRLGGGLPPEDKPYQGERPKMKSY